MRSYIFYGWADNLIDPDGGSNGVTQDQSLSTAGKPGDVVWPADGWCDIRQAWKSPQEVPCFTNGHIVQYFVTRTVHDGLPASDFKSINQSALYLYRCGHVQNIEVCTSARVWIRSICLPEMKKDEVYKLYVSLDNFSFDVLTAVCGCPAGKGPTASCKHVAALCYAVMLFCECGQLPDFLTCTEKLQEWNQPRPKKLQHIPVTDMEARRRELVQGKCFAPRPVPGVYDPRPPHLRSADPEALEQLRMDILGMDKSCVLLQLLTPSVDKIEHDHMYAQQTLVAETFTDVSTPPTTISPTAEELEVMCQETRKTFNVSSTERKSIEMRTRGQFNSPEWFVVRARRISGSKCGKILLQKKKTPALLKSVLYRQEMKSVPKPILWGRMKEKEALSEYVHFMNSQGHVLKVEPCGFIIHPDKGWLGASPDALVTDISCAQQKGIAEVKCPFSKRDITPQDACKDANFYCSLVDGRLHLNRTHPYYHQVQLQLYVGTDLYSWCDFCVFTTKGILVERIFLDPVWCTTYVPQLEEYFSYHMLPEIVYPQYKPSHIL